MSVNKRPAERIGSASKKSRFEGDDEFLLDDVHIKSLGPLIPPACLVEELPMTDELASHIYKTRKEVADVIQGRDDRLLIIVGPCSIHDTKAAKEYAVKLRHVMARFEKDLLLVMRVYFEKPRTTVGWKGLINDPDLNGTFKINKGLRMGRALLLEINELGIGCAVEFLDTISPQYIADLVSWGAIGARTTESQMHRELASGLSAPIGFKNGTAGDVQVAVDAMRASSNAHSFLGVTQQGVAAIVHTKGNPNTHIILRGGKSATNYDEKSVSDATATLDKAGLVNGSIMIDCSHANSRKVFSNQKLVAKDVCTQLAAGNTRIRGMMIESHLFEGKQSLDPGKTDMKDLAYGVSVTDGCLKFEDTVAVLASLAKAVSERRTNKEAAPTPAQAASS